MIALRAYGRLKHPRSSYGLTPSPTLIRLSLLIIIIVDYCLKDDKNKTIGRNICYNEKNVTTKKNRRFTERSELWLRYQIRGDTYTHQ